MNTKVEETYSEVYSILNMFGEFYINKLPYKLYKMIEKEKSDSYNPQYTDTLRLDEQNIKKEAISMIALFHLKYWCESEEEKNCLKQIFKVNQEKHDEEAREKYNIDNIFNDKKKDTQSMDFKENAMIEYKETKWKKILNFIKGIFRRR